MVIDLHGLIETEAILKIDAFLYDFESSYETEATIITGNGIVLKDLAIDAIEKNRLKWKYEGQNQGAIIVFK